MTALCKNWLKPHESLDLGVVLTFLKKVPHWYFSIANNNKAMKSNIYE